MRHILSRLLSHIRNRVIFSRFAAARKSRMLHEQYLAEQGHRLK